MTDREFLEATDNWMRLANGEQLECDSCYVKFIGCWVAFNAHLNRRYPDLLTRDRAKIDKQREDGASVEAHRNRLNMSSDYESAIQTLAEHGVASESGLRKNICSPENWSEVLDCVYLVRCNLFHGGKQQNSERDGELVEASLQIMLEVCQYERSRISASF